MPRRQMAGPDAAKDAAGAAGGSGDNVRARPDGGEREDYGLTLPIQRIAAAAAPRQQFLGAEQKQCECEAGRNGFAAERNGRR